MAAAMPIMMGLSVAGGALGAVGQLQAADANIKASEIEAQGMEEQAALDVKAGYERGKQIRYEGEILQGRQTAGYASAGVSVGTGSALYVQAAQARQTELDAMKAQFTGEQSASVLKRQADLTRYGAKVAKKQATLGAIGSLLGGGGRALMLSQY